VARRGLPTLAILGVFTLISCASAGCLLPISTPVDLPPVVPADHYPDSCSAIELTTVIDTTTYDKSLHFHTSQGTESNIFVALTDVYNDGALVASPSVLTDIESFRTTGAPILEPDGLKRVASALSLIAFKDATHIRHCDTKALGTADLQQMMVNHGRMNGDHVNFEGSTFDAHGDDDYNGNTLTELLSIMSGAAANDRVVQIECTDYKEYPVGLAPAFSRVSPVPVLLNSMESYYTYTNSDVEAPLSSDPRREDIDDPEVTDFDILELSATQRSPIYPWASEDTCEKYLSWTHRTGASVGSAGTTHRVDCNELRHMLYEGTKAVLKSSVDDYISHSLTIPITIDEVFETITDYDGVGSPSANAFNTLISCPQSASDCKFTILNGVLMPEFQLVTSGSLVTNADGHEGCGDVVNGANKAEMATHVIRSPSPKYVGYASVCTEDGSHIGSVSLSYIATGNSKVHSSIQAALPLMEVCQWGTSEFISINNQRVMPFSEGMKLGLYHLDKVPGFNRRRRDIMDDTVLDMVGANAMQIMTLSAQISRGYLLISHSLADMGTEIDHVAESISLTTAATNFQFRSMSLLAVGSHTQQVAPNAASSVDIVMYCSLYSNRMASCEAHRLPGKAEGVIVCLKYSNDVTGLTGVQVACPETFIPYDAELVSYRGIDHRVTLAVNGSACIGQTLTDEAVAIVSTLANTTASDTILLEATLSQELATTVNQVQANHNQTLNARLLTDSLRGNLNYITKPGQNPMDALGEYIADAVDSAVQAAADIGSVPISLLSMFSGTVTAVFSSHLWSAANSAVLLLRR